MELINKMVTLTLDGYIKENQLNYKENINHNIIGTISILFFLIFIASSIIQIISYLMVAEYESNWTTDKISEIAEIKMLMSDNLYIITISFLLSSLFIYILFKTKEYIKIPITNTLREESIFDYELYLSELKDDIKLKQKLKQYNSKKNISIKGANK